MNLTAAFAALSLTAPMFAQELSAVDRQAGIAHLERTRAGIVEAVRGLSAAQLNFKPGSETWSIAENLEHIALAEDFVHQIIDQAKPFTSPVPARDVATIDAAVVSRGADRNLKGKAPEPITPRGLTPLESLARFEKSRAASIDRIRSGQDLRRPVAKHPLISGVMDAYQWLLFESAHSERHMKQILEVKADPNFPKH